MSWIVTSGRLRWDEGTRLSEDDLEGCNIAALVEGGHLAPAADKTTKKPPVPPATDITADEPEEQD